MKYVQTVVSATISHQALNSDSINYIVNGLRILFSYVFAVFQLFSYIYFVPRDEISEPIFPSLARGKTKIQGSEAEHFLFSSIL